MHKNTFRDATIATSHVFYASYSAGRPCEALKAFLLFISNVSKACEIKNSLSSVESGCKGMMDLFLFSVDSLWEQQFEAFELIKTRPSFYINIIVNQ